MVNAVNQLKSEITAAAYRHFEETGDVSMRRVGDAVGVSATALYYHFRNKQALLDAVADRGFQNFDSRLRSLDTQDSAGIIRGVLTGYRQFAADHPNLFRLMFVEPRPVARKFPGDFAAHRSAVFNLLWKAVADCMAGEADADESLHLAQDVWALTHGQILLWRAGRFTNEALFHEVLSRSVDRFIDTL